MHQFGEKTIYCSVFQWILGIFEHILIYFNTVYYEINTHLVKVVYRLIQLPKSMKQGCHMADEMNQATLWCKIPTETALGIDGVGNSLKAPATLKRI